MIFVVVYMYFVIIIKIKSNAQQQTCNERMLCIITLSGRVAFEHEACHRE